MMSRPLLEEKAPVDEPPQITEPAQGRVATKSTTNIRLRPSRAHKSSRWAGQAYPHGLRTPRRLGRGRGHGGLGSD